MAAEFAIPSSETTKPQNVLLGGVAALALDVLEQIRLAPAGILRRIQVILSL